MNKVRAWLYGLAVGAALMYIFDPERGQRRRALMRDQVVSAWHKGGDLIDKKARHFQNRVTGLVAETRSRVKDVPAARDPQQIATAKPSL